MSKFSESIINRIKKAEIKPKPKWQFILLNALLWLALVVSILIGGLDLSLIIRMLTAAPWEMVRRVGPSPIHSILMILPYLWIFILIILFLASHYLIKHTKKGYRYRPIKIVIISLVGSVVVSFTFYFTDADRSIERFLVHEFSPYGQWQRERGRNWVSPDNGLITGFIKEVNEDELSFEFEDLSNKDWQVDFSNLSGRGVELIEEDRSISIFGKQIDDNLFKAEKIRPWSRGDLHAPFRKRRPNNINDNMPRPFRNNFERSFSK